jgi:hypothetical protein
LALIYQNLTASFTRTPTTLQEKGVSVAVSLSWAIIPNDDEITSISINQGVGTVTGNSGTISGGNRVDTITYTITISFNRNGTPTTQNNTVTVSFTPPQYYGSSNVADVSLLNYATLGTTLNKLVQTSTTIAQNFSPTAQYVWFVSTKNNATILDGSLSASIGVWDDGVSEFYKKTVVFTLADGVTTQSLTFYRTRELKTRVGAIYTIQ